MARWMRLLVAVVMAAGVLYAMQVFGAGAGLLTCLAAAALVGASAFVRSLAVAGGVLALLCGVGALLALGLLLVAGTVGGGFRLSESNQVVAVVLLLVGLLGLAAFMAGRGGGRG